MIFNNLQNSAGAWEGVATVSRPKIGRLSLFFCTYGRFSVQPENLLQLLHRAAKIARNALPYYVTNCNRFFETPISVTNCHKLSQTVTNICYILLHSYLINNQ